MSGKQFVVNITNKRHVTQAFRKRQGNWFKCAMTTLRPAARKLIATPEINWFPRNVIDATPCTADNTRDAQEPANRPSHAEPVV